MLIVSVPSSDYIGECLINKRPCDFRIEGRQFWFRSKDEPSADWDRRDIIQTRPNGDQTYYVCEIARTPTEAN